MVLWHFNHHLSYIKVLALLTGLVDLYYSTVYCDCGGRVWKNYQIDVIRFVVRFV